MSIFRRQHTANFTTISNKLFDDPRLKADEVGILAFLISRPHNWELRRSALQRRWDIGPVTMKRIINNWMRSGWCKATKKRLPNGTFCIFYDIFDLPGEEQTDVQIREALSLVSSEASTDDVETLDEGQDSHPPVGRPPPPCQPVVAGHPLVDHGVAYIDSTNTELSNPYSTKSDGMGEARARGSSVFTEGSKALASAFWRAVGFDDPLDIPPEFAGIDYRAIKWEAAGWTADLIDAEARKVARDKPLKPISYFEKVFATSFAKRQTPLPIVAIREAEHLTVTSHGRQQQSGNIIQAADRLVETLRNFDAGPGGGADELRRGESAPIVRQLSKG